MANYDVPAAVEEASKAVQSVSETSRVLGGYLAGILGEAPYTVGQIINDRLNAFRFNKMVDYWVAAKKRLEDAGLRADDLQLPSPSIEVPLLAAASLEDRAELRELWEKLLAAAIAPGVRNRVRARHIEILKQLEPLDALLLQQMDSLTAEAIQAQQQQNQTGPQLTFHDFIGHTAKVLKNYDRDEITTALENLYSLRLAVANVTSQNPLMKAEGRNFLSVLDAPLNKM